MLNPLAMHKFWLGEMTSKGCISQVKQGVIGDPTLIHVLLFVY